MKKKLITFVVMMVVFLIGCGTNSDSSSTTSEKASKSDIDTISDMYNEYQTESQDETHEEDAELVNKYRHYICIMYILHYYSIYYIYIITNLFEKGKK